MYVYVAYRQYLRKLLLPRSCFSPWLKDSETIPSPHGYSTRKHMNLVTGQKNMIANLKTVGSSFSLPKSSGSLVGQSQVMAPVLDQRYGAAKPFAERLYPKRPRPLPEWKAVQVLPPLRSSTARPGTSIWLPPKREGFGEKLIFAVLTATAVATLLYGFSSILDLLQNWAAFQAGLSHFLS